MIFRALCKLSNVDLPEGLQPDSVDVKSKVLSLELVLAILQSAGPSFKRTYRFINTDFKRYLCPSIGINGISSLPRVFQLTLNIFLLLISNFKVYLKDEIAIYFTKIFLRILESDNSTTQAKGMVLDCLLQICNNAQILVDIFVNYDCSLESQDIFGRMVNDLSTIAKGSPSVQTGPGVVQESTLKTLGLECLVTIMKSLVEWSKELVKDKEAKDSTSDTESVDDAEGRTPDRFEKKKHIKLQLETGKEKFNVNAFRGVQYLVDAGLIEYTPESIARFIKDHGEELDKEQIGEYFAKGGPKGEFNKKVLHAYIDTFTFTKMPIDLAIRHLLGNFRMVGEAQAVDRIIEKFAARWVENNPESIFTSADAAYMFAYAIIMLATDLHSPYIKKKITLPEWQNVNRDINEGKLPHRYQEEIYNRIAATPLRLTDNGEEKVNLAKPLDPHQKELTWVFESKQMAKRVQQMLKQKRGTESKYFKTTNIQPVRPMFDISWCPMLAAFSVLLETSEDSKIIDLCLMGFKCAIRVSSTFYMETPRNMFVSSLFKFTHLNNLKEIRHKNIASIKTLITVAHTDGDHLQESWKDVLECISKLETMHLLGAGLNAENTFTNTEASAGDQTHSISSVGTFTTPRRTASSTMRDSFSFDITPYLMGRSPAKAQSTFNPQQLASLEGANAELISKEIESIAIDRLFTDSTNLNNNAIVDFVKCLCAVSQDEISSNNPRMFCLQKLVEVAYYNMGRIRIVWARIWEVMGQHFTMVGCHKNLSIAMYAIDSLRQLAMKFLAKDELANYHFQKDFLKPFESIIQQHTSVQTRDMCIRCLSNMVLAQAQNIKSGWKSIFAVLSVAATDTNEKIVRLAFELVESIMSKHFKLIADSFFVECVNCLIAFAKAQHFKDVSQKALASMVFCAGQLAGGNVCPLRKIELATGESTESSSSSLSSSGKDKEKLQEDDGEHRDEEEGRNEEEGDEASSSPSPSSSSSSSSSEVQYVFTDEDVHIKYWFPVLTGFSEVVTHPHIDVRTVALERLFGVLKEFGTMFTPSLWNLVFKGVILPIFIGVRVIAHEKSPVNEQDNVWIATTCLNATQSLVDLLTHFFNKISFLLDEVLSLLASFVLQETANLAEIGCTCLLLLVMKNGDKFTPYMWNVVCMTFKHVMDCNMPVEVFAYKAPKGSGGSKKSTPAVVTVESQQQQQNGSSAVEEKRGEDHPANASEPLERHHSGSTEFLLEENVRRGILPVAVIQAMKDEETLDRSKLSPEEIVMVKLKRATPHRPPNAFSSFATVNARCAVHLLLLQAVNEIFFEHYKHLSLENVESFLEAIMSGYRFAYSANNDVRLRTGLGPTGVMTRIIKIEVTAMGSCLRILFTLYAEPHGSAKRDVSEKRLTKLITEFAEEFIQTALNSSSPYSQSKVGIMVQILQGILQFDEGQFEKHVPLLYRTFVGLMLSERKEIRAALQPIFERIGQAHGLLVPSSSS
jgi:brefeldin A-inhibited guanine nucleotide-exchange protein